MSDRGKLLSSIPFDEGDENKVVELYYEFQVDLAVIFGANRTRAEKEILETLDLEIALSQVLLCRCRGEQDI